MNFVGIIIVLFILITAQHSQASISQGVVRSTEITNGKIINASTDITHIAKMWGLTKEEYLQYQKQIQNTPSAKWWQQLDPPQVLGMNATTKIERMHYAKIDVALDQIKVAKELAFQRAYAKAFSQRYPHAKLIDLDNDKQNIDIKAHDSFLVFFNIHNIQGALLTNKLLKLVSGKLDIQINIYFTGKASFYEIEAWARGNELPHSKLESLHISLNHNQNNHVNKLKQIMGKTNLVLPIIIRVRNDKASIIELGI